MRSLFVSLLAMLIPLLLSGMKPQKDYRLTPEQFELPYQQNWLPTVDGYFLNSWYFVPPEGIERQPVTVVISYGDAGNMGYTLAYSYALMQQGYTVLTYDYRGFGDSSEVHFAEDLLYDPAFSKDLNAAIIHARMEDPDHETLVWSFSMGTLVSSLAYGMTPYDYLVAEGLALSPAWNRDRILAEQNREMQLPSTYRQDGQAFFSVACPVLLVAGTDDEKTPVEDSYTASLGHPMANVLVYQGGHGEGRLLWGSGPTWKSFSLFGQLLKT